LQTDFRLVDVEHEVLQVGDLVLHGQRHLDDVLVLGEHLPLLGVGPLAGHVLLEFAVHGREVHVQARPDGFIVLAEAQHHGLLLLIHYINRAVQPHGCQYGNDDGNQANAASLAGARAGTVATTFLLAAEHAIQAVLQLAEGLVEIRRAFAISTAAAPAATAPRILIVRVATRLIPSHSALHLIKRRRANGAPMNATNATTWRQSRRHGLYCKVCCSRNSVGRNPARLTSRFSSMRGSRTDKTQSPCSSCSSLCTAPRSKNCARRRARVCGRRKVPTNRSSPSSSVIAWPSNSRPLPS